MEFSLHRQLKERYAAAGPAECEVRLHNYRIDVVRDGVLIEIQHGSLSAIRDKVRRLLESHNVLVVKPVVRRKRLVVRRRKNARPSRARMSPKRGSLLDVFHELIYFTRVFPHERLAIDVLLVDIEEWRRPPTRRRRRRRYRPEFEIEDQKLLEVHEVRTLRHAADLHALVGAEMPTPFHTGHLAESLGIDRWVAQRIAYCYRKMGTAHVVGKHRGAWLYELTTPIARAA